MIERGLVRGGELKDRPQPARELSIASPELRHNITPVEPTGIIDSPTHKWVGHPAVGYPADKIQRIRAFITKENWPEDQEACVLEDADCLVFLETKLPDYLDSWEDRKMLRILRRTFRKMTPEGRKRALGLTLGERERELLRRATLSANV